MKAKYLSVLPHNYCTDYYNKNEENIMGYYKSYILYLGWIIPFVALYTIAKARKYKREDNRKMQLIFGIISLILIAMIICVIAFIIYVSLQFGSQPKEIYY